MNDFEFLAVMFEISTTLLYFAVAFVIKWLLDINRFDCHPEVCWLFTENERMQAYYWVSEDIRSFKIVL